MTTCVNYDAMMRLLKTKGEVNSFKLEDIEWVRDDGTVIQVDPKIIEDWKFVGMTNISFVELILCRIAAGEQEQVLKELEWKPA